jgi:uncharacterized protein (DUF433 family)
MQLPDFLEQDSDGEILLKGHRIRLIDVSARYEEGHSPETIVLDHYPTLNLAIVHKTIAFYLEHEEEVKALLAENAREMERLASQPRTTPTLTELRRRMEKIRRAEVP